MSVKRCAPILCVSFLCRRDTVYRELVLLTGLTLAGALLTFTVAPTQAQQDLDVGLRDFAIDPTSFTATAGQTVHLRVTNTGGAQHNLAFEQESVGIGQVVFPANLQPGQSGTADFTFAEPGTWKMYCPVGSHRDRGMLASVLVQDASAAPAPQPVALLAENQLVVRSDGAIFFIKDGARHAVSPMSVSDAAINALPEGSAYDNGMLPTGGAVPAPPPAAAPPPPPTATPLPAPPPTNTPVPQQAPNPPPRRGY
jgi:uncharacterized cupredoxin-like copper-binding protein